MDSRLVVLELFLKALNIPVKIETIDDRKRVQKAVYLGQRSGVDLGYRFGWYLLGPYSPELTRDYFPMVEAIQSGDNEADGKNLRAEIREKLQSLSPIMSTPEDVPLQQAEWLELLASYDFLRRVRHLDDAETIRQLKDQKPALVDYAVTAKRVLEQAKLLSAAY